MENTESILEAARKIVGLEENVDTIAKMVATLKVGDNTNFGKVVDISNNSITFKAKDLPKTKIAFNQRKIGSSDFVLSALTKLNEAYTRPRFTLTKKAKSTLSTCENMFDPNGPLAHEIMDELGKGYKEDFTKIREKIEEVIDMWEEIEYALAQGK